MFSIPFLHDCILETLPRYAINLGSVMKLFWNAIPYALELLVKSLENSDGLQTILPYKNSIITILLINILSKVFFNLQYQRFQFVFIPVIVDPQKPR